LAAAHYSFVTGSSATLTITQAPQSISFMTSPPGSAAYGGSYMPAATGGASGNAVTLSIDASSGSGACALAAGVVSFTGVGTCVVDANQAGNTDYSAAPQVQQSFTIARATLSVNANAASVTFGQSPSLTYSLSGFVNGEDGTSAGVTGSASCSASPTSPDPGTYLGAITCAPGTLSAPHYSFVTGSSATETITQASQSISFTTTAPSRAVYGGSYTPAATGGGSGNAVTFSIDNSSDSAVCSYSAGVVSFTGVGMCVLDANQAGNADYSSAPQVQQSFSVGKATLAVNASGASVVYGQSPALSYTLSGFANGENATTAGLTGSASCSASPSSSDPGSYPAAITCSPGTLAAAHYSVVTGSSATLTITQASQSISFTTSVPSSAAYGGSYVPAASGGASGNAVTLSIDSSSGSGVCSLAAGIVSFTGVGTCVLDANQAGNTDYAAAPQVQQSFSIGQATLAVDASAASVTFGQLPSLAYTLSGFVNGDNATSAGVTGSASCSASPSSPDPGSYPGAITCAPGTLSAAHYAFLTGSSATETITQASQSISFTTTAPTSAVYGDSYTPAAAGGASGNAVTFTIDNSSDSAVCSYSAGVVSFTGVGTCVLDANQAGDADYSAAPQVQQSFSIGTATLSVNADAASVVYGQSPSPSSTLSGFVNGENATSAGVTGSASCSASPSSSDPGTYVGAIVCTHGTLSAADYTFVTGSSGTLTITQAAQSISFTTSAPSGSVYGGSYAPAATGGDSGNAVTFSIDSSSDSGACLMNAGVVSFTGVGTCVVDANQAATTDYAAAPQVQQSFSIGQATLSVNANDASQAFGQAPALTYALSGFVNGEDATAAGVSGQASCSASPSAPDPGTYPGAAVCAPGTLSAANYTFVTGSSGALTITQAAQSINFTTSAPSSAAYRGSYTPAATGGASGNAVTFSIDSSSDSGVCSLTTGTLDFTGVGTCVLDANQAGSTDYSAAPEVQQTFSVGRATLSVNANDVSQVYRTTPTLGYSLSGFVNGENATTAGVTGSASCSASPSAPDSGTYAGAIVCTPGTLSAANYTFVTGSSGTLTITPASQSVSFSAPALSAGVRYGHSHFTPALATSGLHVLYSNASGQCTIGSLSLLVSLTGVGSCTVTASQPGNRDYRPAPPVTATFTIGPATLRVNARSVSVPYGATPHLSYVLAGIVRGDTVAALTGTPACSIVPGTPTAVGRYPGVIKCLPGTLTGANYRVVQGSSGTLTIARIAQAIHFSTTPRTPTYGGTYVVSVTAGASGNPVSFSIDPLSAPGACSVSGRTVSFTAIGRCTIDANQSGSTNYSAARQARQTFTIHAATLTVTADHKTMAVGGPVPSLTATIGGFVNGDTAAGAATGSPSCSTTATASSRAGTYPITCTLGTLAAPNYVFKFVRGTLTVG
jgi:hypothetical protein